LISPAIRDMPRRQIGDPLRVKLRTIVFPPSVGHVRVDADRRSLGVFVQIFAYSPCIWIEKKEKQKTK
jgi:hypothetical protein